ncbi:MAG: DUF1326 domain-containing protein [Candidatus Eisenbacteria bacterium]|nr:DUF1326 domain-containing protein [Candidatus Eisenbacteria bacterium]
MKQDSSAISRRSMKRHSFHLAAVPGLALLSLSGLAPGVLAAMDPARQPTGPATGWAATQEFALNGNYVEACTDAPLCPGHFGSNRPGPGCQKVMVFQVTRGRWHSTDLSGLSVLVIAEAPAGETVFPGNCERWVRREVWLPEAADSAQAEGLTRAIGILVMGAGGPPFTRIERVPLATGITAGRIFVEAVERLRMILTPGRSINGIRPPDLNNLGHTFRFLGPLYVYDVDTLYCPSMVPDGPVADHKSGVTAMFSWSSEAAYAAATVAAPPGKPTKR